MSEFLSPEMFPIFATHVKAVLAQANIPIGNAHNFATPGERAYVISGGEHDAQNRLCALVYREAIGDPPEYLEEQDAPPEYKAILERAGYVVQASRVPGGLDGGWDVWAVYPPLDATES